MGAKNHAVVMPDCNYEDASNSIISGFVMGQRCMASASPDRQQSVRANRKTNLETTNLETKFRPRQILRQALKHNFERDKCGDKCPDNKYDGTWPLQGGPGTQLFADAHREKEATWIGSVAKWHLGPIAPSN